MMEEITLVSAFLVGFLGSVHCIGMCGGIIGALTLGLPGAQPQRPQVTFLYLLYYNIGRIFSYAIAGGIAGFIGSKIIHTSLLPDGQMIGAIISSVFMIALGLYINSWWQGLIQLEKLGSKVWRFIEPACKSFLPVKHSWQALMLGVIWGWLPCGMVYAVLVWSLSAGSAIQGASLMIAFGLGTLPTLLALGAFAKWLEKVRKQAVVRKTAGLVIICFGIYGLFSGTGHHHLMG
jgi:sulfite exporter TauE/SafE